MALRLRPFLSEAKTTVLEGLQQPVALVLCLFCVEFIALQPILQLHTFGESGRLTRDCGMAFLLMFGFLLTVFTTGFAVGSEIRNGTAAVALSKPVSRTLFLIGKFLGTCGIVAVFSWVMLWQILLACRTAEAFTQTVKTAGDIRDMACGTLSVLCPVIALAVAAVLNATRHKRIGSWFFLLLSILLPLAAVALGLVNRDFTWRGFYEWNMGLDFRVVPLVALLLSYLCILSAVSLVLSIRLQLGQSLAIAFAFLFLGFFASSILSSGNLIGKVLYVLIPDAQHFWRAGDLADGGRVSGRFIAKAVCCAVSYIVFVLSVGSFSLSNKDV